MRINLLPHILSVNILRIRHRLWNVYARMRNRIMRRSQIRATALDLYYYITSKDSHKGSRRGN